MAEKTLATESMAPKLLDSYLSWDKEQMPEYVKRERFSRTIFYPILVKFKPINEFRTVQIIATIHKSGVGCLSFWLYSMDKKLNVDEMLDMIENLGLIEVDVALPFNLGEVIDVKGLKDLIEEAMMIKAMMIRDLMMINEPTMIKEAMKEKGIIRIERKEELDEEANQSDTAEKFGMKYECYHCNFSDLSDIYMFLIYTACLTYLDKGRSLENLKMLMKANPRQYDLLNLYEFEFNRVKNPFKDVVKNDPRQIFALVMRDKLFRIRPSTVVRNILVDTSSTLETSQFFHVSAMVAVNSSETWEEMKKQKVDDYLLFPGYGEITDTADFEILNCLKVLLYAYDSYLTELIDEVKKGGVSIDKLVEAERKIAYGLEEIYSARHAIYSSVWQWWPIAEERLGIKEMDKAVKEKLSVVRRMITTMRDEEYRDFESKFLEKQTELTNEIAESGRRSESLISEVAKSSRKMEALTLTIIALTAVLIVDAIFLEIHGFIFDNFGFQITKLLAFLVIIFIIFSIYLGIKLLPRLIHVLKN